MRRPSIARRILTASRRLVLLAVFATASIAALGLSASAALAEDCPNAQLRAESNSTRLPECRAYELVTNPYGEGFAPDPNAFSDEGAVAYRSAGSFAGNVGTGHAFNQYVARRTGDGWQTTAYDPRATEVNSGADALSADLRTSLFHTLHGGTNEEAGEFVLRRPDGTVTSIGPFSGGGIPAIPGELQAEAFESSDLSHVIFTIFTHISNVFEYVGTGNEQPQIVGVDNAGNQIINVESGTCANAISRDGRVIVFGRGSCAGTESVWARINGTTSIEASASLCTRTSSDPGGACNAPSGANFAGMATDGSRIYFTTTEQLVNGDTDQTEDLYACDIPPGTPAPIGLANPCASLSEVSGAASGANVENVVRISDDGSRVYFVATGVLAPNLGANDLPATAGYNNLYVWEKDAAQPTGKTTFIAKLNADDVNSENAQTTADGRYLVFSTSSALITSGPDADTDESQDVYRYDGDTGELLRLSTDASGTGGNELGFDAAITSSTNKTHQPRTAITSDAGAVVFQTSEALSPADTNGTPDTYEWHEGHVSLISSGRPTPPESLNARAWITPSGTDIFFATNAQLTAQDGNTQPDMYDARIDGGFPFAKPASCSGEMCQGALNPHPQAPGTAASASFNGPGNPTPPAPPSAATPKPKALTPAQKLAKALKACRAKHNKKKRLACEKQARKTYRRAK